MNRTEEVRKEEKFEKRHITFSERFPSLNHNLAYFTLFFIEFELLSLFLSKISALRSRILKNVSPPKIWRVIFEQPSLNILVKHDLFQILALNEDCMDNFVKIANFLSVSFKCNYFGVLIHIFDWCFVISSLKYV